MTIADYSVLQDGNFELRSNQMKRFTFDLPSDYVAGTFRAKPLLLYRVAPKNSATWVVAVNDPPGDEHIPPEKIHEVVTQNKSGSTRSMHEPISGTAFVKGGNIIDFRVTRGRAVFSDIVLFYQRDTGEGD